MAVELDVKIIQAVTFDRLLKETSSSIKLLINCNSIPLIEMLEMKSGSVFKIKNGGDIKENSLFLLHFNGYDHDKVSVTTTKIDILPPYITEKESGVWATISVEGGRETNQFVLAAGIAHALAKINQTTIIDEVEFWSSRREAASAEFEDSLRMEKESEDFLEAANQFYLSLNGKQ